MARMGVVVCERVRLQVKSRASRARASWRARRRDAMPSAPRAALPTPRSPRRHFEFLFENNMTLANQTIGAHLNASDSTGAARQRRAAQRGRGAVCARVREGQRGGGEREGGREGEGGARAVPCRGCDECKTFLADSTAGRCRFKAAAAADDLSLTLTREHHMFNARSTRAPLAPPPLSHPPPPPAPGMRHAPHCSRHERPRRAARRALRSPAQASATECDHANTRATRWKRSSYAHSARGWSEGAQRGGEDREGRGVGAAALFLDGGFIFGGSLSTREGASSPFPQQQRLITPRRWRALSTCWPHYIRSHTRRAAPRTGGRARRRATDARAARAAGGGVEACSPLASRCAAHAPRRTRLAFH